MAAHAWVLAAVLLLDGSSKFLPRRNLQENRPPSRYTQTPKRPQEPKPPFPYLEERVSYVNPDAAGVVLGGTFTKPNQSGRFPAVLLITGPGPQDRDETIAGHKPFLVLADYLTRRDIAVLRVDDRGTASSTGNFGKSTTLDFAADAEAGVRYLLTRKDVDLKRIGLIGHSEGSIVAAMVAARMPEVSFIVMLAGIGVPGEQVLLTQREHAERAAHMPEGQIAADKNIATMVYEMVREGKRASDLRRALSKRPASERDLVRPWLDQADQLTAPWLRFFLSYDPGPALEKVKCPVLALAGAQDMDVIADQNVPAMKAAFGRAGNHDVTIEVLPRLNYLFQTADTGLAMEYATIPETMSPVALDAIGTWIAKHIAPTDSQTQPE